MSKIFMVRTQGHGVHWEKPFANYPSKEDVAALLAEDTEKHGLSPKTGEERELWAAVMEVEMNDGKCEEDKAHKPTDPRMCSKFKGKRKKGERARASGTGETSALPIEFKGEGRVINPGDPDYETITAADVGTLDLGAKPEDAK